MMARLDVIAPHLLSGLINVGDDPQIARLVRLLARADCAATRFIDVDTAVLRWFGHDDSCGVATLSAGLDLPQVEYVGHWLRADPVHLRADATRVILFDAESVGLDAEESDALIAHLNVGLAESGLGFERGSAVTRWYVRLSEPSAVTLASPRSLRGQAVEDSLEALRRAGALNRLMTEAQMVLYEAPVNLVRAEAGRAPINSVWFWGGGVPVSSAPRTAALAFGADALLAACAAHGGVTYHATTQRLAAALRGSRDDVLLLDHVEPEQLDMQRFQREVLEPGLAALASGRLNTLVIHAHLAELEFTRGSHWRWWRRASTFLGRLRAWREAASEV